MRPPAGSHTPTEIIEKRDWMFSEKNIIPERILFKRHFFDVATLPKVILHGHNGRNKIPLPIYEWRRGRQFNSVVTIEGKQYSSVFWNKNARYAAAFVCSIGSVWGGLFTFYWMSTQTLRMDTILRSKFVLLIFYPIVWPTKFRKLYNVQLKNDSR